MVMLFRKTRDAKSPSRRSGNTEDDKNIANRSSYKISRTLSKARISTTSIGSNVVDSKRSKGHHLARHRRHTGLLFTISILTVVFLLWVIYQLTATVVVSVNDNRIDSSFDKIIYEKAITSYMDSNLISRLRVAADGDKMRQFLAGDYPEIKMINDNGKISIFETNYLVSLRKPVAGWKINDRQYYVDSEGVSFERNYYDGELVQVVDETGARIDVNGLVASSRFLSFIGRLVSDISDKGYIVTEVRLPSGTTRQIDIKLKDVSPYVKLSIDRGVGVQVEDMDRALKYLLARQNNIVYVDIRIPGKAYYK